MALNITLFNKKNHTKDWVREWGKCNFTLQLFSIEMVMVIELTTVVAHYGCEIVHTTYHKAYNINCSFLYIRNRYWQWQLQQSSNPKSRGIGMSEKKKYVVCISFVFFKHYQLRTNTFSTSTFIFT